MLFRSRHRELVTRAPRITAAEMVKVLKRAGWRQVRQRGSHVLFRHPSRAGLVTVPMHAGRTLKPKTAAAIIEAAGLDWHLGREVRE